MWQLFGACLMLTLALGLTYDHTDSDSVVLVQMGQARARVSDVVSEGPYAYEKFAVGEVVEARSRNSTWAPVMVLGSGQNDNVLNVRLMDGTPNNDLPNVPREMLRRSLLPGQSDWYLSNALNLRGLGLKFRYSKNLENSGAEYLAWGSRVVGTDEGDGWLKTALGYLPIEFRNATVLTRKGREQKLVIPEAYRQQLEVEAARMAAPAPKKPEVFRVGEEVEYETKAGRRFPAYISELGTSVPGTYTVIVRPNELTVWPAENVPPKFLHHKVASTPAPPQSGPEACQRGGCIRIRVKHEDSKEYLLQVAKLARMEMVMKMVCNKMKISWDTCQAKKLYRPTGEEIGLWTQVQRSGLNDDDLISMEQSRTVTPAATQATAAEAPKEEEAPKDEAPKEDPLAFLDE